MKAENVSEQYKNCWFQSTCKEEKCPEICIKYEHMLDMFKKSGLNENQWYKYEFEDPIEDIEAYRRLYELSKNMESFYDNFKSLYIWSDKYLNGKTTWSIKLLQNYLVLWTNYRFDYPCGYFISGNKIKEAFKSQVDNPELYNTITNNLKKAELLVIDNVDDIIGDQKVENYLAGILDERFSAKHSVIYTSHLSPDRVRQRTQNGFLISRILDLSDTIEFKAPTYKINKEVK